MEAPEMVKGFSEVAYVININHEPMPLVMRSYHGPYQISSPKDGQTYSVTEIGWVKEKYDSGDFSPGQQGRDRRSERIIAAYDIAEDICSEINSHIPGLSDSFWGVFASDSPKAKQTELERSQKRLETAMVELVAMANKDWSRYHRFDFISDSARVAAKYLKEDCEWLAKARKKESCPCCGGDLPVGDIAIHTSCGAILDESLARKFRVGPYAIRPSVQPGS